MRIGFDGRGINWYSGTGIGTYTENLLKNLLDIDKENYYQIYWDLDNSETYKKENSQIVMAPKRHHRFFETSYIPYNLKYENINLYHIPQNGIGLNPNTLCKKIVTIHDLIPYIMPETVGRGYLLKFLKEMPIIMENSNAIITVSEYSKKDILRFFPIDENKIYVAPLAANDNYKPLDKEYCQKLIKEKYNIDKPYILYLGGFSERKNVHTLISAFSKIYKSLDKEYNLVIVGSYRDESQYLIKLRDKLGMNDNIIFTGYVPYEDLPTFYNASETFVYPSLYEGFGLPPLEAMNCKVPVISSNITSIPEVVENAGILINPNSETELYDALGTMLSNESLRNSYAELGYKQSQKFSWRNTAQKTLEVYKKVCEDCPLDTLK